MRTRICPRMRSGFPSSFRLFVGVLIAGNVLAAAHAGTLTVEGIHVVPHVQSTEMRYRRDPDFSLGARVEVFLRNESREAIVIPSSVDVTVRDRTPAELLAADEWGWHDLPSAWGGEPLQLAPGALTVWSWNGKRSAWGVNTRAELVVTLPDASETERLQVPIAEPVAWLSALTFLGPANKVQPDSLIFHLVNRTEGPLRIEACRLWLPKDNASWRALHPQPWMTHQLERFPADGVIHANDRGGAQVTTGPLPLTYAALEVRLIDGGGRPVTVWAHQRIKREVFDIGGGWIAEQIEAGNSLQAEPYLRTLRRMHINAGMHQEVPGYSDTALFDRYPLKYMNRLEPISHYDSDSVLPRIHAVEFLGEPQYGGGRPVPPQDVWNELSRYAPTRLPTSVTHSEERVWRFYAGLSDYPHYDAYRVSAPAPDAWRRYDRWGGETLRWGAPLETIGVMTRSLRELNRPRPIAYWSQGAHHGWGRYGGRERTSPTPDELRQQAYHALANRITSLYWFNLSLRSLVAFPDLIQPITYIGREIRMLDDYYLEGDAVSHKRMLADGRPDWDLDVLAGPRGALMFALDLGYRADQEERVFEFDGPRDGEFIFSLPNYLRSPLDVFRVDADGVTSVEHAVSEGRVTIRDQVRGVAIYVAARAPGERERIESRRQTLAAQEDAVEFDPGRNRSDLEQLKQIRGASAR